MHPVAADQNRQDTAAGPRALLCFRCGVMLRFGTLPGSHGLCARCFTRLTIVESAKALYVVLLLPAMLGVAALTP